MNFRPLALDAHGVSIWRDATWQLVWKAFNCEHGCAQHPSLVNTEEGFTERFEVSAIHEIFLNDTAKQVLPAAVTCFLRREGTVSAGAVDSMEVRRECERSSSDCFAEGM